MNALPQNAAGTSVVPLGASSFGQTMAAYRFYSNDRISMAELIAPLRQYARWQIADSGSDLVLLVHDWTKLSYGGHASKRDQAQLAQAKNRGYEMMSVLAVSGANGTPLAPMEVHLKTAAGGDKKFHGRKL